MNPKSAIAKGKELENFVANLLTDIDPTATRQHGSGNGLAKGDVRNTLNLNIECKNTAKMNWKGASEQVAREGMGYGTDVVIWHPPQKSLDNSVVIINIHDWHDLLKKSQEPKLAAKTESREEKYKIQNLIQAAKNVLKIYE